MEQAESLQGRTGSILVVEDEVLIRMLIADALRDEGYAVIEAASGDEAHDLLAAGVPADLLITDIRMPGQLNGRLLAKSARALRPELIIAFSSAQPDAPASVPDLADAVLSKPFTLGQLTAMVRKLLGGA